MKKIITTFLSLCMIFMLNSCGERKYTMKDLSLYDSKTDKYIEIGYSMKTVKEWLGEPTTQDTHDYIISNTTHFYYENYALGVNFDKDDCVDYFVLETGDDSSEKNRFKIGGKLGSKATMDDFIKFYPDSTELQNEIGYEIKRLALINDSSGNLIVTDPNTNKECYRVEARYDENGLQNIYVDKR